MPYSQRPRSAYLHIPFCHRRCYYCDFAVVPLGDRARSEEGPGSASIAEYLGLIEREIACAPDGPPLSTVYFGGGTPSLLSPDQIGRLLDQLRGRYGLQQGAEITLEMDPASFDQLRAEVDGPLAPFGLDRTRIAHRESYEVQANWKLLVENYNECYHCAPAHPEYRRTHPTHLSADRVEPFNLAMEERARGLGIPTDFIDRVGPGLCPPGSVDFSYSRHSLYEDYDTGSDNGKPVAPLLGSLQGYDQGAMDLYVGFLNPLLVYNDHAVIYRFIPIDRERSVQEILWLVHEDAEEGRDYDLQRLTWLWDATTKADKHIIEKNQKGVNSRFYQPGPLAEMEAFTQRFINYYLERLGALGDG